MCIHICIYMRIEMWQAKSNMATADKATSYTYICIYSYISPRPSMISSHCNPPPPPTPAPRAPLYCFENSVKRQRERSLRKCIFDL